MLSHFSAQLGAYGTKHGARFALFSIIFYEKFTVTKIMGIGAKLSRDLWNIVGYLKTRFTHIILMHENDGFVD